MDSLYGETYDDFYIAFLDKKSEMIYPTDPKEVSTIKKMIKMASKGSLIYIAERNLYYKLRISKKIYNGQNVQAVEISNVTEFFNQVTNASIDEITHLTNRKEARNMFCRYIEQAHKSNVGFSVILSDIDGFKEINDTYGHINGDTVLGEVSRIMYCSTRQEKNREQDIVARIGGDEFLIVLKNASKDVSESRAEKIRENIQKHRVELFNESDICSYISAGTISVGLYYVSVDELNDFYEKGYTTEEIRSIIIDRTDTALYTSKNSGKNQVTSFDCEKTLKLER